MIAMKIVNLIRFRGKGRGPDECHGKGRGPDKCRGKGRDPRLRLRLRGDDNSIEGEFVLILFIWEAILFCHRQISG